MTWFLLACSATPNPAPSAEIPAAAASVAVETSADAGPRVFAQHCATCHGATGKGDGPAATALTPPPMDLTQPRPVEKRHPPSRADVIRIGSPGTAMVGFEGVLSPTELVAVQAYVHTLAHASGGGPGGGSGPGGGGGSDLGRHRGANTP